MSELTTQENISLYNKILQKEICECYRHARKYNLSYHYNPRYDAIGLAYYKIKDTYPQNKELIDYAHTHNF